VEGRLRRATVVGSVDSGQHEVAGFPATQELINLRKEINHVTAKNHPAFGICHRRHRLHDDGFD
jgi:hypothetical protein